jgi:hypothetical protein
MKQVQILERYERKGKKNSPKGFISLFTSYIENNFASLSFLEVH